MKTRRDFLKATVVAGFVPPALPVRSGALRGRPNVPGYTAFLESMMQDLADLHGIPYAVLEKIARIKPRPRFDKARNE